LTVVGGLVNIFDTGRVRGESLRAEEAQILQRRFLRGVLENIKRAEVVYDPLSEAALSFRYDGESLQTGNSKRSVKERMEELGVFDRTLFKSMPYDPYLRYTVTERGILAKGGSVLIHAVTLSQRDEFIQGGCSDTPIGRLDVEDAFLRLVDDVDVFHYVALFSPTGFAADAKRSMPVREHAELVLVEKAEETRWRLHFTSKSLASTIRTLFDPESRQEKFHRLMNALNDCDTLKVSGGFLLIDDFLKEQDVPEDVAELALKRFLASDEHLGVEEIDGRRVLKRRRL